MTFKIINIFATLIFCFFVSCESSNDIEDNSGFYFNININNTENQELIFNENEIFASYSYEKYLYVSGLNYKLGKQCIANFNYLPNKIGKFEIDSAFNGTNVSASIYNFKGNSYIGINGTIEIKKLSYEYIQAEFSFTALNQNSKNIVNVSGSFRSRIFYPKINK